MDQEICQLLRVDLGRARRCSKSHGSGKVGPGEFKYDGPGRAGPGRVGSGRVGPGQEVFGISRVG